MATWGSDYGAMADWNEAQKSTFHDRYMEKHFTQKLIPASQQICNEIDDNWPMYLRARVWIGTVMGWLDHPYVGEEECFAEASEELARLRKEVA